MEVDARLGGGLTLDTTAYPHMLQMLITRAVVLYEEDPQPSHGRYGFGSKCKAHYGI